jgi:hypothetical protein
MIFAAKKMLYNVGPATVTGLQKWALEHPVMTGVALIWALIHLICTILFVVFVVTDE